MDIGNGAKLHPTDPLFHSSDRLQRRTFSHPQNSFALFIQKQSLPNRYTISRDTLPIVYRSLHSVVCYTNQLSSYTIKRLYREIMQSNRPAGCSRAALGTSVYTLARLGLAICLSLTVIVFEYRPEERRAVSFVRSRPARI